MAPVRCHAAVCQEHLQALVKASIFTLEDEAFLQTDVDDVATSYENFLVSIAALTDRLNKAPLETAIKAVFPGRNGCQGLRPAIGEHFQCLPCKVERLYWHIQNEMA